VVVLVAIFQVSMQLRCTIRILDLRVDSTNHTRLAMLCLGAVEPNGLGILDPDRVCENLVLGREGSVCRHETGEEGFGLVGHDVLDRDAGVVESGLDYGVVLS
jgi:hypothetical protein